ncbi:MAG TPA: sporulation protein YqfC [Massilibacterium sp.]|nr:sporulation protein YqfC [Massilibacterium sp.]
MSHWVKQFGQIIKKPLGLPDDITYHLPRITAIGNLHLYIENHEGILYFSKTKVCVAITKGSLIIEGKAFVIKMILPDELLLEGVVESFHYLINEGDKG